MTSMNVTCYVAPYESDPQITYLVNAGFADFAISEDSDLIVFGCKKVNCSFLIYSIGFLIIYISRFFINSIKSIAVSFLIGEI